MLFNYKALTNTGEKKDGQVEAINVDVAISQLQKRGLIISEIHSQDEKKLKFSFLSLFNRVSNKDIVILSRQMATLFQAQVSALRIFNLLGSQTENPTLQKYLLQIADDLQGGSPISAALRRYPDAFSNFYVNMVRAGEESGKLDEVFSYLADYLDRTYAVASKAKNALIYPAFVILTFIGVMILMLTVIIPKIAVMITDSGQTVPIYTQIVLWISNIFVNHGIFVAVGTILFGFILWKYSRTESGSITLDNMRLNLPYLGDLYRKLYLSRIADNMNTMIISGIPMLKALEITSSVVDNKTYQTILDSALIQVKGGSSLSNAFGQYKEIPNIMVQMVKVGEETGELGSILKSLANFYQREVTNAVDTLVGLIEPVMIVVLGVGVGILLTAVLMPIYNIASQG
ncbi:MAG: type II secretion system F family protein [Candidatus Zambryskibacteria bacterium]|nr:type II secretion system F family protein [Candidatus Zambryskibacteria bacterium]